MSLVGGGVMNKTLNDGSVRADEESVYWALRHFWHAAMYAGDLGDRPEAIELLDEKLVVVRLGGEVRCFPDLCMHRGTALSLGCVEGDQLRCAYHGWTYGPDGVCTSIPARFGTMIPKRARLHSYPVLEQGGMIWVCLEDQPVFPAPVFPEFDDPSFGIIEQAVQPPWMCSSARRIENYVDFAHFAWVHDGILGSRDRPEVYDHEVWRDEDGILRFDYPQFTEPDESGSIRNIALTYRITMPFTVWVERRMPDGSSFVLFFTASPISRKSCNSLTLMARNYDLTEEEDRRNLELNEFINAQDRPIVESQRPEELPVDLTEELHIRSVDKVSVEYRRWLRELGQQFEGRRQTPDQSSL
jgi:vanillate O-demethylase monooxygenase subunit